MTPSTHALFSPLILVKRYPAKDRIKPNLKEFGQARLSLSNCSILPKTGPFLSMRNENTVSEEGPTGYVGTPRGTNSN